MSNARARFEPVAWWYIRRLIGRSLRQRYNPKLREDFLALKAAWLKLAQICEKDLSDRIRERAYQIWIASGYRSGEAEQHWLAAEREILSALQSTKSSADFRPAVKREAEEDWQNNVADCAIAGCNARGSDCCRSGLFNRDYRHCITRSLSAVKELVMTARRFPPPSDFPKTTASARV